MQSNLGRVALGIAAVVAAVVLLLVLRDDGGDEERVGGGAAAAQDGSRPGGGKQVKPGKRGEPAIPVILVEEGRPLGGVEELTFEAGERIRFEVRADSADEVHVHGYDVSGEVGPGQPGRFDFPATIEGVFEAELHGSGEQILELRVDP